MGEPLATALADLEQLKAKNNSTDVGLDVIDIDDLIAPEGEGQEYGASGRPLPNRFFPSPWYFFGLMMTVVFHIVFIRMRHWVVSFDALVGYYPAPLQEGGHVMVQPLQYRGKGAMCPVHRCATTNRLVFVFQRQHYECFLAGEDVPNDVPETMTGDGKNGTVRPVKCAVNDTFGHYLSSTGLDDATVALMTELYGKNKFEVTIPDFLTLLKQQMMSPIPMFQLFVASFWFFDLYWRYTLFNMLTIVGLECTTAFQRRKNLNSLQDMANKPFPMYAYRNKKWVEITSEDLLPGDLASFKRHVTLPERADASMSLDAMNVVPADSVILSGSAVLNEATLTGESVPQIKDALSRAMPTSVLDIEGEHKVNMLFSGTTMVSTTAGEPLAGIPPAPDGGVIVYVMRTGFASSQGELMRQIEFSKDQFTGDLSETMGALILLLFFAICSCTLLTRRALAEGNLSNYEIMMKCVQILTSVVPPTLPMQTALAVNTALMALLKAGTFCTEPHRMPWCGKVTACLFDKTGTLTTDQLQPAGIVNHCEAPLTPGLTQELHGLGKRVLNGRKVTLVKQEGDRWLVKDGEDTLSVKPENLTCPLVPMIEAAEMAQVVIGGCHTVMNIDGMLIGDPIETVGFKAIHWRYDATTQTARPGDWSDYERMAEELRTELAQMQADPKTPPANKLKAGERLTELEELIKKEKARVQGNNLVIKVLHRHHFSSQLQRMSTICEVSGTKGNPSKRCCALVKGSPEMIGKLLVEGSKPAWYDRTYRSLAERGMRVLALAYKWTDSGLKARDEVERDLTFAGFAAFCCMTRSDSAMVIKALQESGQRCAMLTGDSALTALHVADELKLVSRRTLLLQNTDGKLEWVSAMSSEQEVRLPFEAAEMPKLHETYDLMVTEEDMLAAIEQDKDMWNHIDLVSVFARMSPQGKSEVIRHMQVDCQHSTLMCGDGGNDVGALKQAEVGIALLCGHGNANAQKAGEAKEGQTWESLNEHTKQLTQVAVEKSKQQALVMQRKWKEISGRQQEYLQLEVARRVEAGEDGGFMTNMNAMKTVVMKMKDEYKAEQQKIMQKNGSVYKASASTFSAALEDVSLDDGVLPTVRMGDASISAPFTSRVPSVRCVVDLIRQGRCTLLSTVQQQQILILECMLHAFTVGLFSLAGSRSSEVQMMATNTLMGIACIAFSYATPLDRISPVRPLRSLFHPAIIFSVIGQAVIHIGCLYYTAQLTRGIMGEAAIKELIAFQKNADKMMANAPEPEDPLQVFAQLWAAPFKPNLFNTAIYLVETAQQIAVLLVNYKGRPYMIGFTENSPMCMSLVIITVGVVVCAWEVVPYFNTVLQLVPFPDDGVRFTIVILVMVSLIGTFIWDRLMLAIFAPEVFHAMWTEMVTTRPKDLLPLLTKARNVILFLGVLLSGNVFIWIVAFFLYKKHRANEPSDQVVTPGVPQCAIL